MAKSFRSAGTGRFVKASTAARYPRTTVGETKGGGSTDGTFRSVTGKFVTPRYGKSYRGTTVKDS